MAFTSSALQQSLNLDGIGIIPTIEITLNGSKLQTETTLHMAGGNNAIHVPTIKLGTPMSLKAKMIWTPDTLAIEQKLYNNGVFLQVNATTGNFKGLVQLAMEPDSRTYTSEVELEFKVLG